MANSEERTKISNGNKVLIANEPHLVVNAHHAKPGKGVGSTTLKLKNMITGSVTEKTYQGNDTVEMADVFEKKMKFLYKESDENAVFMDENYEQIIVPKSVFETQSQWIKEGEDSPDCIITLYGDTPIAITLPIYVDLEVVEAPEGRQMASGGSKVVTLETGAKVHTPQFIKAGQKIRVHTESGEYKEKVK